MQASRRPRRAFAAAFVAIAAAPACIVASNDPAPPRQPPPPAEEDHRVVANPPVPQPEQATYDSDTTWNVEMQDDGSCLAYRIVECPKGARCNPPPPSAVECPTGIALGTRVKIHASAGSAECYTMPESGSCPEKATCNPPPPRQTACPQ
jgi:hypothetical protein